MKKLLIIGAGGHGKVIAEAASQMGQWQEIAFLDDRYPDIQSLGKWQIIGKVATMKTYQEQYPDAAVAIGDNKIRLQFLQELKALKYQLPVIQHPSAIVSPQATIGVGTVILANAVI